MTVRGVSRASQDFSSTIERSIALRKVAIDSRLRPLPSKSKQAYYHAALAACVAGWDAYINNLVREFYQCIKDPLAPAFHAIVSISEEQSEQALRRFNTPNAENTRKLLVGATGFDPINYWIWPRRGMGGLQVRERMNQILKVRHSFAHGFSVPAFHWTQSPSGNVRLTSQSITDVEKFFIQIVASTDRGLSSHMNSIWSARFPPT